MMNVALRSLFVPRDPLSGAAYLGWGLGLFALKYALDYLLARFGLGFSWWPTDYFLPRPGRAEPGLNVPASGAVMMLALALPFIWAGVNLTTRRLRTLNWPLLLVCLFFIPYVNFAMFAVLALKHDPSNRTSPLGRRFGLFSNALLLTVTLTIASIALLAFATIALKAYGWGLFVGIPFFTGFIPAVTYRPDQPLTFGACFRVMFTVQTLIAGCLLLWNMEGAICLAMGGPIFLSVGSIGILVGTFARKISAIGSNRAEVCSAAFLLLPLLFWSETRLRVEPTVFKVTSRIEVNAPAGRVWKSVISFSELPPPTEMIFRAGIAYPIRAEIHGSGPGATRHCVFSTGPFVEPISVWDEPRLLRFTVSSNPPPMRELGFGKIDPPHLHGFMESERGQFELNTLPDGRTELVGTTWYRHGLRPERYWRVWSDYIIHKIHMRVLRHIKSEAETRS